MELLIYPSIFQITPKEIHIARKLEIQMMVIVQSITDHITARIMAIWAVFTVMLNIRHIKNTRNIFSILFTLPYTQKNFSLKRI